MLYQPPERFYSTLSASIVCSKRPLECSYSILLYQHILQSAPLALWYTRTASPAILLYSVVPAQPPQSYYSTLVPAQLTDYAYITLL